MPGPIPRGSMAVWYRPEGVAWLHCGAGRGPGGRRPAAQAPCLSGEGNRMSETLEPPTVEVECASCHAKNRIVAGASSVPRCGGCQEPLPWVVDASDADFAAVADEATIPVLVDMWAHWCAPGRMVSQVLE